MKPRSLIAIVLIGTSLIAVAPTGEKARQADKTGMPGEDVNVMPRHEDASREAKLQTASFPGDGPAPKDRDD
ncbi:MAG: hypothetical protein AB7S92_09850 [Parvibaculaceae bacterium]